MINDTWYKLQKWTCQGTICHMPASIESTSRICRVVKGRITQTESPWSLPLRLAQWFWKCGPWTGSISFNEGLRNANSLGVPTPDLLNQTFWGWGPVDLCFNKSHRDSDAYWNLGTTGLAVIKNLLTSDANHWELSVSTLGSGCRHWN